ncbi:hypothetical protein A2892_04265 [Candidatus Woesebacteria bacterium RIFCSPLOWO2_01_FULL_39_10b]|uniref:Uncharacterized protein n=1 Tax=Candidatus Woesebacteria bacterium RIFCSPLOWO2_01_FULL_39_10b TaxID=1802517 RepID=A0A1F8B979_9BACT|nr:MAG: hypothetical protein A2892_04265 [Candidatus Woesebacteria bacterium RIFCSPLOWO2_01_FULL_39_10b]
MDSTKWELSEPDDEEMKFEVYTNYISGLSYLLNSSYKSIVDQLTNIDLKHTILQNNQANKSEVQKFLNNSWNSERILNSPKELNLDSSFVKFANHWSPVLAYYSIFLCFQSLFLSLGWEKIIEHRSFLDKVSSLINKKRLPFIYPWTHLCWGCSYYKKEKFNFDVNLSEVNKFSPLTNPVFSNESVFIAKILRTTRRKQEEYRELIWKRGGKVKNVDGSRKKIYRLKEKQMISDNIQKTSLFDFLYRLRIRSNYEDADIFFMGTRNQATVINYFRSLTNITNYSLFFIESLIASAIGVNNFIDIANTFIKSSGNYNYGIARRIEKHIDSNV